MADADEAQEVVKGEGYAVGNISALGHGGGFRKIRRALIDAATARRIRNVGEGKLVYVAVGGQGGYVDGDGHLLPSEET